jgi:prepilin signal peptidase PulO-like enzyme (type II secretory pathway)
LVELITAALFVISYIFWPAFQGPSLETMDIAGFIVWLILLVGLISLAVYDLRWMLLPNRIIFPLLGLAAASVFLEAVLTTNHQPLITGFFGAAVGGGLFYLLFQLSGGKWIGGGDVKLGFLLGLVLGDARPAFLMLFLASALGALVSIPMLVSGGAKRSTRIPFGPFLIAAVIIVKLFGQGIIDWYMNMYIV